MCIRDRITIGVIFLVPSLISIIGYFAQSTEMRSRFPIEGVDVYKRQRMGKRRIIAETGAGQHGVAPATVCALMNMECIVYMLSLIHIYNGLLKASISSATNAHRLGANEAPPAIISSFLGKQLSRCV